MKLVQFLVYVAVLTFVATSKVAAVDWRAFSIIEKAPDAKSYKETVYLVNDSSRTITLKFPNFEFQGHGDTPAESIGPMGNIFLSPGDAVRFVHIVPVDRKDGFAKSIGIQDIDENIPVKPLTLKASFGDK